MYVIYTTTQLQIETFKYLLMWLLKILLQINSNSLVIEQKQKQTNKQTKIYVYMNIEFRNSMVRLSFMCCIMDMKSAWINPPYVYMNI